MEEIQNIELSKLLKSKFNPRRELPNMGELTESIRKSGIIEPLLVRPINGGGSYEVVDGHRRFAAAVAIHDLDKAPCIIRPLTDEQTQEIQLIKALQREGLHPLDEAIHIVRLIETCRGDIAEVASKIGKPENYVRRRAQLTKLIPIALKEFQEGKIPLDIAFRLARLDQRDQKEAVKNGLNQLDYYERLALRELRKAPWSLDDAELFAKAGACSSCPKQSGAQAALFEGSADVLCLDYRCFNEKLTRHMEQHKKSDPDLIEISGDWSASKGMLPRDKFNELKDDSPECPTIKRAMVASGPEKGKLTKVCVDPKCKVHGMGRNLGAMARPQRSEKEQAARRKELQEAKVRREMSLELVHALITTNKSEEALRYVAEGIWTRSNFDSRRRVASFIAIEPVSNGYGGKDYDPPVLKAMAKMTPAEIQRFAFTIALAPLLDPNVSMEALREHAKRFKVDLNSLRKKALEEINKQAELVKEKRKRKEKKK